MPQSTLLCFGANLLYGYPPCGGGSLCVSFFDVAHYYASAVGGDVNTAVVFGVAADALVHVAPFLGVVVYALPGLARVDGLVNTVALTFDLAENIERHVVLTLGSLSKPQSITALEV